MTGEERGNRTPCGVPLPVRSVQRLPPLARFSVTAQVSASASIPMHIVRAHPNAQRETLHVKHPMSRCVAVSHRQAPRRPPVQPKFRGLTGEEGRPPRRRWRAGGVMASRYRSPHYLMISSRCLCLLGHMITATPTATSIKCISRRTILAARGGALFECRAMGPGGRF
jgi:hypothetical protein